MHHHSGTTGKMTNTLVTDFEGRLEQARDDQEIHKIEIEVRMIVYTISFIPISIQK